VSAPADTILRILANHVGEENSIPMTELLQRVRAYHPEVDGLSQLRGIIHDLRQAPHLIGSGPRGYFIPATLDEARRYVEVVFRGPSRDQLVTARRQRQAAVNHFGRQMRMFS